MKKRILSVLCITMLATVTLTACGSTSTSSSSTSSSSSSQESNSELSNDELKELAMEGGISPYDFKEEVKEKLGKKCYEENIFSDFGEIFNAELDQVGMFWHSKDEAVNHNAGDSSGTVEGIHLLTYNHEINTGAENPAYLDVVTFITDILGPYEITLYTNYDYSYFYLKEPLTAYGSFNIAFRIIDNSMVYAVICEGKEDPYDFLCGWDTTGKYGMSQVNTDDLVDITDIYEELYTASESENDNKVAISSGEIHTYISDMVKFKGPYMVDDLDNNQICMAYVVENISDSDIFGMIRFYYYNESGRMVGGAMGDVECLGPGQLFFLYEDLIYNDEIAFINPVGTDFYETGRRTATEAMKNVAHNTDASKAKDGYTCYEVTNNTDKTIKMPGITVVYSQNSKPAAVASGAFHESDTSEYQIGPGKTAYAYVKLPDDTSAYPDAKMILTGYY